MRHGLCAAEVLAARSLDAHQEQMQGLGAPPSAPIAARGAPVRTASVAGLSLPLPTHSLDPKTGVHVHLPQGTVRQRAREPRRTRRRGITVRSRAHIAHKPRVRRLTNRRGSRRRNRLLNGFYRSPVLSLLAPPAPGAPKPCPGLVEFVREKVD
jgi:hypothetical protein